MFKSPYARVISGSIGPLVRRIEDLLRRSTGDPAAWVVGVAADPERALFRTHRVDPSTSDFVWVQAPTPIAARAVARYFHELGCLGRTLWDEEAYCVYAYARAPGTWP